VIDSTPQPQDSLLTLTRAELDAEVHRRYDAARRLIVAVDGGFGVGGGRAHDAAMAWGDYIHACDFRERHRPGSGPAVHIAELAELIECVELERLAAELTPAQMRLVQRACTQASLAQAQRRRADLDSVIEQVARHFGPLGPAIRAVASHIDSDRGCLDNCEGAWPQCGAEAPVPEVPDA
jgi:hypothetical protein